MAKTLCIDFDGVIHSYSSGWKGADVISDPPNEGAFAWLLELLAHEYEVCIYSSRSKEPSGIEAMQKWFWGRGFPEEQLEKLNFPTQKPATYLTLDDRAICFIGAFPTIERLESFLPWHQRPTGAESNAADYDMSKVTGQDHQLAQEALECIAGALTVSEDGLFSFEPSAKNYLASMFSEARNLKPKKNPAANPDCYRCGGSGNFMGDPCTCLSSKIEVLADPGVEKDKALLTDGKSHALLTNIDPKDTNT